MKKPIVKKEDLFNIDPISRVKWQLTAKPAPLTVEKILEAARRVASRGKKNEN